MEEEVFKGARVGMAHRQTDLNSYNHRNLRGTATIEFV